MSLASDLLNHGAITLAELQQLADAREPSKLAWDWIFLLGPREREGGRKRPKFDGRHIYFTHDTVALEAVQRAMPLWPDEVWPLESDEIFKELEPGEATPDGVTVVAAENLIPARKLVSALAKVKRSALTLTSETFAHYAADYVSRKRVLAFEENRKRGPSDALMLFRNPRGIWQLSRFSEKYGPTGHQEGTTPLELLERLSIDARPDDGSALRRIMSSVEESHEFWRRG